MFGFFSGGASSDEDSQSYTDEAYEDNPRSMADYYNDLEAIIANIRKEAKDANTDPAFVHAASILEEIITLCRNIEDSYNPLAALDTNAKRSKLIKTIGPNGMIEIKGDASRLLVEEYKNLMIAVSNKEYWPNPPIFYALVVNNRYASELESHAAQTAQRIQEYEKRMREYDVEKNTARPRLG